MLRLPALHRSADLCAHVRFSSPHAQVCFEDFDDAPSAPPLPRASLPGEAGVAAAERADGAEGAGPSGGSRGAAAPDKGKAAAAGDAELRTPLLPPLRPRQSGCVAARAALAPAAPRVCACCKRARRHSGIGPGRQ